MEENYMSWRNTLRKNITSTPYNYNSGNVIKTQETATRSALLWATNDYDMYQQIKHKIKSIFRKSKNLGIDFVITELALWLPEQMIHMEGFMEELEGYGEMDSISDVDWDEVAEYFWEDIETIQHDIWGEEE